MCGGRGNFARFISPNYPVVGRHQPGKRFVGIDGTTKTTPKSFIARRHTVSRANEILYVRPWCGGGGDGDVIANALRDNTEWYQFIVVIPIPSIGLVPTLRHCMTNFDQCNGLRLTFSPCDSPRVKLIDTCSEIRQYFRLPINLIILYNNI